MKTLFKSLLISILFVPIIAFGQTTVNGTVTEQSSSLPLPGVNVIIKGTATGTATDFDGNYVINANNGDILVFSFIGYQTLEVTYNGQSPLDVQLLEDASQLDEVVIIGYGTTTVKDATGAVVAVTEKDFNKGNNVTAENLISGRVAGVTVTTGGAPGDGSAIRIRGGASLNASNDPLIVIDGLPISNSTVGGSRSVLSSINPNDIASMSILKDASATAIYGSRASNGVIIIETKKGSQELQVELNLLNSIGNKDGSIDVLSADEYRSVIEVQQPDRIDELGQANTNWQDEIYRTTSSSDINLSVRGSLFDNSLPARLSVGRTDQQGIRLTSKFERTTTSLTLTPRLFDDHLKVRLNANASFEKNRFAAGVDGGANAFNPTHPVYDENSPFNGYFQYYNANGTRNNQAMSNPVASLLERKDLSDVNRFYGNLELDYTMHFLPELRAVINIGYDKSEGEGSIVVDENARDGVENVIDGVYSYPGSRSNYTSDRTNRLLDGYLVYKKEFDNYWFDVTAGYSYQKFESEGFTTSEQLNYVADGETDPSQPETTIDPDIVLIGFFGRANVSFLDKYLLTLSYRRDGTSRFSEDNRWGNFPAAAFAWNMSDEDFLKDSETISNLKLRLSWGITGQQDIGAAYSYLANYQISNVTSQVIIGGVPVNTGIAQFRNEAIKWEETTTYNVGLDYGLFDNRVNGSIDAYYKKSEDLLTFAAVADGANFGNAGDQNIGSLISQGIEFSINSDIIQKENFNWNINYNFAYNDLEIDELAFDEDILTGGISGGTGNTIQIHREGFSPYSFYVYKQLYDSNNNPIEGAYADLNGDNIITPDDRYIHRNRNADITMGFMSNINYKKFDFSFNLRASFGNQLYNNVNSSNAQFTNLEAGSVLGNIPSSTLDTGFMNTPDVILSDIYVEDASFLKMDNITLGYTFDKVIKDTASIRIYTGVQNVFTITEYSGLDPEVFNGIDNTIYPRARTYMLGANIKF
ncbi:MAG TPA: SusC/RagA family TonB-linked outer membrane protein [Flavobacteriaceae bacterium]|nr:SusC/RagA family TonB-linked outer membrane protein [Flavobacteriaceae bacterium]